jgi:hypothetical protein
MSFAQTTINQPGTNTVSVAELNLSDGTAGQAIVTDGNGTISFATVGVSGIVSSADATAITIDSSEKVGLNKVPSTWHLDVLSSDVYVASFEGSNDTGVLINSDTGSGDIIGYSNSTSSYNALNIRGASGTGLVIDTSNRVGINRTPSITNSKLEVGGADNVPLINVEASGATGGMGIGSTGLQLFHGSTARMKINSSGQITAPYQPSFLAYPSATYTASGGAAKATFASTSHNVGSHYNTATSKFTAPVAGNYLFVCDLAINASISAMSYIGIGVRKNGTGDVYFGGWGHKADGETNTTAGQYAKTSSQVILNLAQGDYIEVYIELSGSHVLLGGNNGSYTRFCGQLLS